MTDQSGTFMVNLTFDDSATFNAEFDDSETFETKMTEVVTVSNSDHTQLINRDKPNQHPIQAITDLATELESRPDGALSNIDIQNILGG